MRIFLKAWVAIVIALITATSWGLRTFNVWPKAPWSLISFISFVIFAGLVIWGLYDRERQIKELKDAKPSISVEPIEDNGVYYLKVNNNGAEGTFKAQIQLKSSSPSDYPLRLPPTYDACWNSPEKYEGKILKGHDGYIVMAQRISPPQTLSINLRIFYYNQSTRQEGQVDTQHWIGRYIEHPDGSKQDLPDTEYELSVTISSSPGLREDIFKAKYLLSVDGLHNESS